MTGGAGWETMAPLLGGAEQRAGDEAPDDRKDDA
jgi:hypothetical protein